MSDSDGPSLSDAFHVGTSPDQMREAIQDLARHAENAKKVSKVHWTAIQRVDGGVQKVSADVLELTKRLVTLETKVVMYAALGAFAGGTLVGLLVKFAFH